MGKNHDNGTPALSSWSTAPYKGRVGQTRMESLHYACPCGALFPARVYRVVNATREREVGGRLRAGTLNQVTCPSCGHVGDAQVSVIYHDETEQRFGLMLPESGRTREMSERAELLRLLAEDASAAIPDYVKLPTVVYGLEGLLIWLESEARPTASSVALLAREQDLEERARELDERETSLRGREGGLSHQKREIADARADFSRQRHELEARADESAKRERSLLGREEKATRRDAELNDRESRMKERETRVAAREAHLAARETDLAALEARLRDRSREREPAPAPALAPAPAPAPALGPPPPPRPAKGPRTTPPPPPPPGSRRKAVEIVAVDAEAVADEGAPDDDDLPRSPTLVMATVVPPASALVEPPEPTPVAPPVTTPSAAVPADFEEPDEEPTPLPQPVPAFDADADDEEDEAEALEAVRLTPPEEPVPDRPQPDLSEFGDEVPERTVRAPAPTARPERSQPAAVRRWIESGERTLACVVQGVPYLAASMPPEESAPFADAGELQVLVQLHRLPTYPLLSLVVLAGPPDDRERYALGFPLDLANPAERGVLDGLASEFKMVVDLYDTDRASTLSRELRAPLAENVRYLLSLADEHLKTVPTPQRSFADARFTYLGESYNRLGSRATAFTEDSFSLIPGPAAARVAANVVDFWSDRDNEDYLILVRSFPLPWWRRIRTRVINAALEHGIALSPRLQTLALAQGIAQSRRDLWATILKAASDVLQRRKVNDLDPDAETDNWAAVMRECEGAQVSIERRITEAVAALQSRPPSRPSSRTLPGMPVVTTPPAAAPPATAAADRAASAGVTAAVAHPGATSPNALPPDQDFGDRPLSELVHELERKDGRKDAALELCRRGDRQHLPVLFATVRRMTRGEAIRVLPALVRFGAAAESLFIEGLEARKSFLRQGCALALGSMKAGEATDALVKLLLEEPTEIWREVARALGDIGRASVMSLAARIREADSEGRDRIAVALAHVVARGHRGPVETLASGRDSTASQCAKRALERADDIKRQDNEVRGEGSAGPRETTMVRSFTRHFFESLQGEERAGGDVLELDSSELVMEEDDDPAEEELGEEDILDDGSGGPDSATRRRGRAGRRGPHAGS